MREPQNSHFVLSDAQYVHVLDDRLYVGKKDLPEEFPEQQNHLDYITLGLQIGGLLVLLFFITVSLFTNFFIVTFTLSVLAVTLSISLFRSVGFTATKTILKADVIGIDYHKKTFGYDYFVVRYAGEKGKVWKRRLAIYDSQQCLEQALKAIRDWGFLDGSLKSSSHEPTTGK